MIEIWIDGRSLGKAGAGFTVIMRHARHEWRRSIDCQKISSNQAELKAFEFALKSIKPDFEDSEVIMRTTGRYAKMMLERNVSGWTKVPKTNTQLVEEVRKQILRFSNIMISTDVSEVMSGEIRSKTDDAVQSHADINTRS